MRLEPIAIGNNPPLDINVIIEVPVGGEPIKYELDKAPGTLVVDRFLHTPMRYPGNYGFVPHTLSADGDPIDVLVMEDEGGGDEKIVAVPSRKLTKRYDKIENYSDLPEISVQQIEHFFSHYKDLEPGKWAKIEHWGEAAEAQKFILQAIARASAPAAK